MKNTENNINESQYLETYGNVHWYPLIIYRSGHPTDAPGKQEVQVRLHELHFAEMEVLSTDGYLEQSYVINKHGEGKWGTITIRKGALIRESGRPLRSVVEFLFKDCDARSYRRVDVTVEDYTCYNLRNLKNKEALKDSFIKKILSSFKSRLTSAIKILFSNEKNYIK